MFTRQLYTLIIGKSEIKGANHGRHRTPASRCKTEHDPDADAALLEGFALIHNYVTGANSLTAQCIGPSTVVKIPTAVLESCKQAYPLAAFADQIVGI